MDTGTTQWMVTAIDGLTLHLGVAESVCMVFEHSSKELIVRFVLFCSVVVEEIHILSIQHNHWSILFKPIACTAALYKR